MDFLGRKVRKTDVTEKDVEDNIKKYSVSEKLINGIVVCRRYINPQGEGEFEYHNDMNNGEFVYDEHGNWTHWKNINKGGTVN